MNTQEPTSKNAVEQLIEFVDGIIASSEAVGLAQSAVEAAENKLSRASEDNGRIAPSELFDRVEAAKKELFVKQTEANRAEDNHSDIIDRLPARLRILAPQVVAGLQRKMDETAARLKASLEQLVYKSDPGADSHRLSVMNEFIKSCDGVADRLRIIQGLEFSASVAQTGSSFGALRDYLEKAKPLF